MTKFNYFIAGDTGPIGENDPVLSRPLPVDRRQFPVTGDKFVSAAEYFQAVRAFLSENKMERTVSSIRMQSGQAVFAENIDEVSVFLEKHGEFYHPARVAVKSGADTWHLVLNVAVSDAGLKCAPREFRLLNALRFDGRENFIPRVYEQGLVDSPDRNGRFAIFSGEWFSGFHEFHVSCQSGSGTGRIRVWDPENPRCFLNRRQTRDLYRKIACILAYHFDLETFEQIYPWSHAAGDFVASLDGGDLGVKLITVRGYRSLFDGDANDLASVMEALLGLLADMSVKIRLDRMEGVGDLVWADDIAVPASIEGFFEGLRKKATYCQGLENIPDLFGIYMASLDEPAIVEFFQDVASTFAPQAPETAFVRDKIRAHASFFYHSAKNFFERQG